MYPAFFIVFVTTNKCPINITTVYITTISLYILYTPTCFDNSMSSSGRFTQYTPDQHTNNVNKKCVHDIISLYPCNNVNIWKMVSSQTTVSHEVYLMTI